MATGIINSPLLNTQNPFETAWINFINSLRILLTPIPGERGMDQYLPFKEETLKYALSPEFLHELSRHWNEASSDYREPYILLLMELEAFPRAVEVAQMEASTTTEEVKGKVKKKKWWQRNWLSRASTVTGSVKDILDKLPFFAKAGLTGLKELIDLFRAK